MPDSASRAFLRRTARRDGGVRERGLIGLGALLVTAGPGGAECLGSCLDGLVAALVSMLVYGVVGIVLLVMLIRAKWRRAGLWGLGIVAVLAVGVPLISQAWLGWKLSRMEAREIVGEPPALTTRMPLLVTPDEYCSDNACEAVLRGRGAAGVYVVLTPALEGRDLPGTVSLSDLPLEFWAQTSVAGNIRRRVLTAEERREAAERIDYLVVTTWPYHPSDPGPIEAALQMNPAVSGMAKGAAVRLLLTPLDAGQGELTLTTLRPDILDLSLADLALAIPLAPRNTRDADNRPAGLEEAAQAICPALDPSGNCVSLLER